MVELIVTNYSMTSPLGFHISLSRGYMAISRYMEITKIIELGFVIIPSYNNDTYLQCLSLICILITSCDLYVFYNQILQVEFVPLPAVELTRNLAQVHINYLA